MRVMREGVEGGGGDEGGNGREWAWKGGGVMREGVGGREEGGGMEREKKR